MEIIHKLCCQADYLKPSMVKTDPSLTAHILLKNSRLKTAVNRQFISLFSTL